MTRRIELEPVAGAMVGCAVGDALGLPFEYSDRRRFDRREPLGDLDLPLLWSDDTQQAAALLDALATTGSLDPAWIADRWLAMRDAEAPRGCMFGLHRGTGRGFRSAVCAYARTGDVLAGHVDRPGNGAAMRVAPAAIALPEAGWIDELLDASALTHRDPLALAVAIAVGSAARSLASLGRLPRADATAADILVIAAGAVAAAEERMERVLPARVSTAPAAAVASLLSRLAPAVRDPSRSLHLLDAAWLALRPYDGGPYRAGGGHALQGPLHALLLALTRPDAGSVIAGALEAGDDTDTTGAIAGALAGAAVGVEGIPSPLRAAVAGLDALVLLAAAVDGPGAARPDLLALEQHLCGIWSARQW